ncbi:MAG: DUF3649 domain-containing protein [Pseudomonadota bacterium]
MSDAKRLRSPGRWHITSRVVAAAILGYILSNTASVFLGLALPGDKIEGVATAILLSFALFTAIIMWVFSVKRLSTVWFGLLGAILFTAAGSWLLLRLESTV